MQGGRDRLPKPLIGESRAFILIDIDIAVVIDTGFAPDLERAFWRTPGRESPEKLLRATALAEQSRASQRRSRRALRPAWRRFAPERPEFDFAPGDAEADEAPKKEAKEALLLLRRRLRRCSVAVTKKILRVLLDLSRLYAVWTGGLNQFASGAGSVAVATAGRSAAGAVSCRPASGPAHCHNAWAVAASPFTASIAATRESRVSAPA